MATVANSILLLEDDPLIRDLVEAVLGDDGYDVLVCRSFGQLLARAAEVPGALAVTDFWGRSHETLSDEEREQVEQLARTVPTIMVTARTWVRTTAPADLGLMALVGKPFDIDDLAGVVTASLQRIAADRAAC